MMADKQVSQAIRAHTMAHSALMSHLLNMIKESDGADFTSLVPIFEKVMTNQFDLLAEDNCFGCAMTRHCRVNAYSQKSKLR